MKEGKDVRPKKLMKIKWAPHNYLVPFYSLNIHFLSFFQEISKVLLYEPNSQNPCYFFLIINGSIDKNHIKMGIYGKSTKKVTI